MLTILHLSIIVAFISSIIDLSQILQRGRFNTDHGLGLESVQSLIMAREVGYAISNSLRFLFFWLFVAEPPKAERGAPNARPGGHSGSWNAWGYIGITLRWSTLALILVVFVLQVVWRIDSKFNGFTTLYTAESGVQVILSTVFALKLVLNCVHCTPVCKWTCPLDYLGFAVSLFIGIGLGIGNLVNCKSLFWFILYIGGNTQPIVKFTENMLGRFLQGVNFYILVLCSLLVVFMAPSRPQSGRVPSFRPLSPKQPASSFNVTPPDVSTPNLSALQHLPDSSVVQGRRVERPLSSTRLSVWLATQGRKLSILSHRGDDQDDMNVQLWNQNWVERGQSSREDPPTKNPGVFDYGHPNPYLGPGSARSPPSEKPKLEAPRFGREFTTSMASRYSELDLSPLGIVGRKSWLLDSPVFGLNGIIQPSKGELATHSPRDSVTSAGQDQSSDISHLFRKQEELDNSIAALKLLEGSPGSPISPASSKRSEEPSTARSDVSLSNFPNPPWADTSGSDNLGELRRSFGSVHTVRPSRVNQLSISVDNVPFDLIPPRMPASAMDHNRTLSLPISESAGSDLVVTARTPRFDSQGTQYDVTSFIGSTFRDSPVFPFAYTLTDLTGTPPSGHKKDFSDSSNMTGGSTVTSSGYDDPEQNATIVTLQSQPTYVGSPLARMPVISPKASGILPATRITLPSKPKLDISQPKPAFPRLRQDVTSDTYERPRAVPFMYQ
jgi:hypothetical protein